MYIGGADSLLKNCVFTGNYANALDYVGGGALYINWSQSAVGASFDECTITDNQCPVDGVIYLNYYYYYPATSDWGIGQKQLDIYTLELGPTGNSF